MMLQHVLELGRVGETPGCPARVAAFPVGEPLLEERVDPLLLFELFAGCVRIGQANTRLSSLAVHQDLGRVALAVGFERVLKLPLGATDLSAREWPSEPVAGQCGAEARPQNDDDDVGVVRRGDQILEVMGGKERLALPHRRPQIEVQRKFLVEPLNHPLSDQPLGPHIRGGRDEHPQCLSLGFGHRSGPSRSLTEM